MRPDPSPEPSLVLVSGLLALGLACVHLFARRLRGLAGIPRSQWLSAASGVSVAYVFVHILSDLAAHQRTLTGGGEGGEGGAAAFLPSRHVYIVALAGMVCFYGLERLVKRPREKGRAPGAGIFWVHISSFATLNALIGYLLLHRERAGWVSLFTYAAAMATHFLVNDFGLQDAHKERYKRQGRWLLAGAALAGWALGAATSVHAGVVATLFALLAGGVILNVLKEELPAERDSRFGAFVLGAAGYAALLLAT